MDAILVSNTSTSIGNMYGDYDHRLYKNLIAKIVFRPIDENRTQVEISEGGVITGGTHGLNADLQRWIERDTSCGN